MTTNKHVNRNCIVIENNKAILSASFYSYRGNNKVRGKLHLFYYFLIRKAKKDNVFITIGRLISLLVCYNYFRNC